MISIITRLGTIVVPVDKRENELLLQIAKKANCYRKYKRKDNENCLMNLMINSEQFLKN